MPRLAGLLSLVLLAGCSASAPPGADRTTNTAPARTTPASPEPGKPVVPALDVEVVAKGLEHGWDVGFLPDGTILVTERAGRFKLIDGDRVRPVRADLSGVYATGEGGLMGMVLHPDFASSRRFVVCSNHQESGRAVDVRLETWRLAEDGRSATKVKDLLTGLPTNESGRHSGCRPEIAADGALLVGTGDTARGSYSQDLTNLGGKVLRLDLETGQPLPDNPFIDAANRRQRYVWTYGHRNVQGVAQRPGSDQVFSAEHGPDVNDEVNLLHRGANYGWDPSQGGTVGGYDEDVPMTDRKRFPDAVPAVWQSGGITEAICAAEFLEGEQWGAYDGALVVTALKGAKLLVLRLDRAGKVRRVDIPKEIADRFGRLRAARLGPDGSLYVTTTNGAEDKLVRISPRS